jgi:hypothetical protein
MPISKTDLILRILVGLCFIFFVSVILICLQYLAGVNL